MTAPDFLNESAVKWRVGEEDGVTVVRYPGGPVKWRADCDYCLSLKTYFAPSHEAMKGCRSGGRNHCTCDGCF